MQSIFTFSQLIIMTPILLVYVTGIALAAVCWRRSPRACALALVGLGIMFAVAVIGVLVRGWIISNPGPGGIASISQKLMIVSIAGTIFHATGLALLIGAVFIDRRAEKIGGFDVAVAPAAYAGRIQG